MSKKWDKSPRGQQMRAEWWASYYSRYSEELSLARKSRWREMRKEVIDAYGGKCVCCNIGVLEFLGMNHRFGGGRRHRMVLSGVMLYQHLRRMIRAGNKPTEYNVLCHNCNQAIGAYGTCPHQSQS